MCELYSIPHIQYVFATFVLQVDKVVPWLEALARWAPHRLKPTACRVQQRLSSKGETWSCFGIDNSLHTCMLKINYGNRFRLRWLLSTVCDML